MYYHYQGTQKRVSAKERLLVAAAYVATALFIWAFLDQLASGFIALLWDVTGTINR